MARSRCAACGIMGKSSHMVPHQGAYPDSIPFSFFALPLYILPFSVDIRENRQYIVLHLFGSFGASIPLHIIWRWIAYHHHLCGRGRLESSVARWHIPWHRLSFLTPQHCCCNGTVAAARFMRVLLVRSRAVSGMGRGRPVAIAVGDSSGDDSKICRLVVMHLPNLRLLYLHCAYEWYLMCLHCEQMWHLR